MHIELVSATFGAGPWDGVVMTSANAARALSNHPRPAAMRDLPAFVVGPRTAAAAREAGFRQVTSADGDVDDLAEVLARLPRPARLIYLAGADQASDLGAALADAEVRIETVAVYRALVRPNLPEDIRSALAAGTIDGVLHFSPRSAQTFIEAVEAAGLRGALALRQFCLSQAVANPLAAAGARDLRVAARPNEPAL